MEQPRTTPAELTDWRYQEREEWFVSEGNGNVLKGLAWCCSLQEDAEIARALTKLAMTSYKKLPGIGPRLVKVGNACVWALGAMPGREGLTQLAMLAVKVKFGTAQKMISKALNATAERLGLPPEEILELATPTFGLDDVGVRRDKLGDYTAELRIIGSSQTELTWIKADGRRQKGIPAAVKSEHAEELRELRQAAKDIQRMLPAQRERIDQLHLARKSWALPVWRERYLDHPLVGVIARRLIWSFASGNRTVSGLYCDGALIDVEGRPLDWIDADTKVELWHPIGRPVDEVLSWRTRLEKLGIQQPSKQAHREVYILTDAERTTRTYSNRFAAHILRQHQFNALCAARGWKNKLRLLVDAEYPPAARLLPQWGIRAEYWIEGLGTDYGEDTNETGVYHRLSTDQVRFYPLRAAERTAHAGGGGYYTRGEPGDDTPMPLEEVPPLVFSEIMRDVDLFVGVSSVGNDPRWADGGPEGRYLEYWRDVSFGELGETAKTRRAVLEKLIPRLKLAPQCTLNDKFLMVRGSLRTYKIHLGSGNILMEPNDQYLCIVAAQGSAREGTQNLYLPFEGDDRMAVILSKAMMLADDAKITDESIVRQIR